MMENKSLRDTIKGTNFHFNPPGIVPSTSKVHVPMLSRIIFDVEIDSPASIIPPSSIAFGTINLCCTVVGPWIVIVIICAELHAIVLMEREWVGMSDASKSTNSQWVHFTSTSYFKHIIMKVGSGPVLKFKINPESILSSHCPAWVRQLIVFNPYQNSPVRFPKPFS